MLSTRRYKEHTPPEWGPEVRDWGSRELGLRDPNGYFLTFTEEAGSEPAES